MRTFILSRMMGPALGLVVGSQHHLALNHAVMPRMAMGPEVAPREGYSKADQIARFAAAKAEGNARYLDIDTVFDGSYLRGLFRQPIQAQVMVRFGPGDGPWRSACLVLDPLRVFQRRGGDPSGGASGPTKSTSGAGSSASSSAA